MVPDIDRGSGLPAYRQVAADLRTEINHGRYKPGDRLPSERELIDMYGVSRPTIREAIGLLRSEERVRVEHGKGVFVALPRLTTGPDRLTMLRATGSGFKAGERTEILKATLTKAPDHVAYALDLEEDSTVVQRQRVYLDGQGAVALSTSWLPGSFADVAPELVRTEPLPMMTFGLVEDRTGRRVVRRRDVVALRPVPADIAAILGVDANSIALTMTNTYQDQHNKVTEYAEDFLGPGRELTAEHDLT